MTVAVDHLLAELQATVRRPKCGDTILHTSCSWKDAVRPPLLLQLLLMTEPQDILCIHVQYSLLKKNNACARCGSFLWSFLHVFSIHSLQ